MVRLACCTLAVVERPGTGRGAERRERPVVARIGKSPVAGHAREYDESCAGGLRDRGGTRVGPSPSSIRKAGRVIPELRQHPGAEDPTQSGQTREDLGVRVFLKTARQLSFDRLGLAQEFGD